MSQIGSGGSGSGTDLTGRDIIAWCTFDGTDNTTASIIDGYNVDDVTVNGDGDYTVNFTSTVSNANYAVIVCANRSDELEPLIGSVKTTAGKTTSGVDIWTEDNAGSATDGKNVTVICIGD